MTYGGFFRDELSEIATDSARLLEHFRNSKILVLGGTGFVGTWLVSALLHANKSLNLGLNVTVATRNEALAETRLHTNDDPALEIVEIDLQRDNYEIVGEFTHLVHAATPSSPRTGGLDANSVTEVSIKGIEFLLRKAKRQNLTPVLLHVSSGAVYGPQDRSMPKFLEGTSTFENLTVLSPYALAKVEIERMVVEADEAGIVRGTNPRLFAFAGPYIDLDAHFAVGNFVRDALDSDRITLKGNPKTVRSYLYPTDMAAWLIASLAKPTLKPLHIGSDIPMEMQEVVSRISGLTGGVPVTPGDLTAPISRYVPANSETRKYLGVEQRVSFDEGIERWVRWLKI